MKVQRQVTLALVAMALVFGGLVGSASATSITITNGSFESGTLTDPVFTTLTATNNSIVGWTVSAGSIDYIGSYWQPRDGARSLDMNGSNAAGTIEQSIVVPYAGNVSINFSMAGNVDDAPTVKHLEVSLASPFVFQNFVFDVTGKTKANMGWVDNTAVFSGIAAGTYTLSFRSLDSGSWGPALDNVSASVPDGGVTAALLGVALTGLAFFRRKRA